MYRTRIARLMAVALMAVAAATDWIISTIVATAAGITRRAADFAIRIVHAAPAPLAAPGLVAKSPGSTSTAEQRTWLIPSKSYEDSNHAKRQPTVLPMWRMCAST